jgi:hypothetical protein
MVSEPSTTVIVRRSSISQWPTAPDSAPSVTNTTAKPSTNSTEPSSIRPRRTSASPPARSAPESPVA